MALGNTYEAPDRSLIRSTEPQVGKVAIAVSGLTKKYKLRKKHILAVDNVTLKVRDGEFVAIVGESGSGKSTLLHLMGGLDKPSAGSIEVEGRRLDKMSDTKLSVFRNQTIGFIFQSFYLQPFLNLRQNVEIAAMPSRMKRSVRRERAERLISAVGLKERVNHKPSQLSGGQIQRAVIARALLNNPSIILADEPTGNLDASSSADVLALFKTMQEKLGTTIIVATHDMEIAKQADRVIEIREGKIE